MQDVYRKEKMLVKHVLYTIQYVYTVVQAIRARVFKLLRTPGIDSTESIL